MRSLARRGALLTSLTLAGWLVACGSNSSSPSSSATSPSSPPSGAVATNTITIAGGTVSPKNIVVARGTQVTFVNNDTQSHMMNSDPHPDHTDCPEINQVGFLSPGQSRQTGNMTSNRSVCGFHDHNQPDATSLQGSIAIQ